MNFTAQELSRLPLLRSWATEHRALAVEVKRANDALPELAKSESAAREALEKFMPSELLALGPAVTAAREALSRSEFLRAAVKSSEYRVTAQLAVKESFIKREMSELTAALLAKIQASFSGADILKMRQRVHDVGGNTLADKAESLIAVWVKFGAELLEGNA